MSTLLNGSDQLNDSCITNMIINYPWTRVRYGTFHKNGIVYSGSELREIIDQSKWDGKVKLNILTLIHHPIELENMLLQLKNFRKLICD